MNDMKLVSSASSLAPPESSRSGKLASIGQPAEKVADSATLQPDKVELGRAGIDAYEREKSATPADGVSATAAEKAIAEKSAEKVAAEARRSPVQDAVAKLNDYVQSVQRDLQFEVDETSGRSVIQVVDRKTQEVVRQIPDELALKMAQKLQQDEPLVLLNARV